MDNREYSMMISEKTNKWNKLYHYPGFLLADEYGIVEYRVGEPKRDPAIALKWGEKDQIKERSRHLEYVD